MKKFLSHCALGVSLMAMISFSHCSSKDDVPEPTPDQIEIYVSDAANFENPPWKILKYREDGSSPEIFISTNLGWPQDILFLEDQQVVLVSNFSTGNIVKFDIETGVFVGVFASGIGGPTRMKIGKDNLLYVLQWQGNGKILRYNLNGTLVDQIGSIGVKESIGLDWDEAGNIYVSSFNGGANGFIRKFDPSGTDLGIFIKTGLQGPTNIWFDPNGNLLVNDWSTGAIKKIDANGSLMGNFATGLSQPEGVAILDNGNILIGNGGNGSVKEYTSSGAFVKDRITPRSGGLIRPNAVVVRKVN